jgi:Ti-type conjugative transfer relaxase TraA
VAIYHLSAKVISRGTGRSAVAAAAYRAAERLHDARLGRDHDFTAKAGVVHRAVLLPEGAPVAWLDREVLWNTVEAAERRRDAQLAREVEVALPRELSRAEGIALARDFAQREFVARGMVADVCVHWPRGEDGEAKPHAHLLLTMRRVEGEGFGPKAREWNGRELLRGWRERWAALANARLAELGYEARIDHRSHAAQGIDLEPQHKVGPAGQRRAERGEAAERQAEHDAIARRNGERIAADPLVALDALTRGQSTFTRADLARFVSRHTDGAEQFAAVLARVEASPEVVRLGEDGWGRERLTTREMLAVERRMEGAGAALAGARGHRVGRNQAMLAARVAEIRSGRTLGDEQRAAVRHVTEGGDLALVVGAAGTGKSAMLGIARGVWEAEGLRVRGAALSGIAAEGLEAGSGIPSRTLASLEWGWARGREEERLTSRDVLVVDEAGMVGSRQMERVLSHAREAGAKVVLVGDPEQLQAIEAGAAFRALAERHGAAEIAEVRRQREGWQRDATRELATGRTAEALGRYERAGMVLGHATQAEARTALVGAWAAARRETPQASGVMLAHTRAEVAELNRLAREAMRGAGALGRERQVQTEAGPRAMAAGDRVMFLRNERGLGARPDGRGGVAVKNGTLGTVLAVEARGERLTVALDGAGGAAGQGEAVTFTLRDYGHLEHGYAATVHKAQGVTVDRAHVLAGAGMDRHMAYVALTRHREGVALHWSREAMGSREGLIGTLSRARAKDTSLDYAGPEALALYAERRGLHPLAPASEIAVRVPRGERRPGQGGIEAPPPPPLLPAYRDPWGRDSQGRGTSRLDLIAVAEGDPKVREARADRLHWLGRAYRDPAAAEARLWEVVERRHAGDLRAAAETLRRQGPEALGALRGREGLFSTHGMRLDRANALSGVRALRQSLVREAEAGERAVERHREAVAAQRERDAVEVPGLSAAAWAVLEGVARAGAEAERQRRFEGERWAVAEARRDALMAAAWERGLGSAGPGVEGEIGWFLAAAERRLGLEGMRVALQAARGEGRMTLPGIGGDQGRALDRLARGVALAHEGRGRHAAHTQRQAEVRQAREQAEARAVERRRLGLPAEPERDRQRQGPRLEM